MSQRDSGYVRRPNDFYETPHWVTQALLPHIRLKPPAHIHEPACGGNMILDVLRNAGFRITAGDITHGSDFLATKRSKTDEADGIITNPPYGLAEEFIAHAIELMKPHGLVAMLLRADYDHAATRNYLFKTPFAKRIALTKRIRWIKDSTGSPSFNHSWWIWDWQHEGPPTIGYAP